MASFCCLFRKFWKKVAFHVVIRTGENVCFVSFLFLKGVINPKKQFLMQNTHFISLRSTQALLDLVLKSRNRVSVENCKILQ